MIKPEQVPDAVVEALLDTSNVAKPWKDAIAAAINAWPGAAVCHYTIADDEGYEMVLPLPFPQENTND